MIPSVKRGYNYSPQSTFISELLSKTSDEFNRKMENLKDSAKFYGNLYELIESDYRSIYIAISNDNAKHYWSLAGLAEDIELIKEATVWAHPALLVITKTRACMERFFPECVGKDSTIEKLIPFLFAQAAHEGDSQFSLWRSFAKRHPMSDADIIRYYEIIQGKDFTTWFITNAPQVRHFEFYYPFYESYKIKKLKAPFKILDKLNEENPDNKQAYQLLRQMLVNQDELDNPNFVRLLARSTENLSDQAHLLLQFIEKHSDAFNKVEKFQEIQPKTCKDTQLLKRFRSICC